MSHKDVLALLLPPSLDLGGDHAADTAIDGAHLDAAEARALRLLEEMQATTTSELLDAWERCYGISGLGDPLQVRRARLVQKIRELGRLDRAYFIQLAAALGYEITISEFGIFRAGDRAGDSLGDEASIWVWRVNAPEVTVRTFKAGQARAGEALRSWGNELLEETFEDLKPAHTHVLFGYGG